MLKPCSCCLLFTTASMVHDMGKQQRIEGMLKHSERYLSFSTNQDLGQQSPVSTTARAHSVSVVLKTKRTSKSHLPAKHQHLPQVKLNISEVMSFGWYRYSCCCYLK